MIAPRDLSLSRSAKNQTLWLAREIFPDRPARPGSVICIVDIHWRSGR
jgi:hypothetical protein